MELYFLVVTRFSYKCPQPWLSLNSKHRKTNACYIVVVSFHYNEETPVFVDNRL